MKTFIFLIFILISRPVLADDVCHESLGDYNSAITELAKGYIAYEKATVDGLSSKIVLLSTQAKLTEKYNELLELLGHEAFSKAFNKALKDSAAIENTKTVVHRTRRVRSVQEEKGLVPYTIAYEKMISGTPSTVILNEEKEKAIVRLNSGAVVEWNISTGQVIEKIKSRKPTLFWLTAITSDGRYFVTTVDGSNHVEVWNVLTGELIHTFRRHAMGIDSVSISPDNKYVITTRGDRYVVWDILTGNEVASGAARDGDKILHTEISGNGQYLAITAQSEVSIYRLPGGHFMHRLKTRNLSVFSTSFSPDGEYIGGLLHSASSAQLWNVKTGKQASKWKITQANSINFSVDSKRVAVTTVVGNIYIYDIETGEPPLRIKAHTRNTPEARFSSDGRYLISSSMDETIRKWDAVTGERLEELQHSFTPVILGYDEEERIITTHESKIFIWSRNTKVAE